MPRQIILAPPRTTEGDDWRNSDAAYEQRRAWAEEDAARWQAMWNAPPPAPGPTLWHDDKPATLALLAIDPPPHIRELERLGVGD